MTENTMLARLPALPAAEFFSNPERSILTADGSALLTYDPATQSGFVYTIAEQRWSITAPCGFEQFAVMLAIAGHTIDDSDDGRRWIDSCLAKSARLGVALH